MRIISQRFLALALPTALLLSALSAPANALTVPITVCSAPACVGTPTQGWDGPGLNAVTIDYFVGNPFRADNGIPTGPGGTSIGLAAFDAAIAAAQAIWSAVVQVDWNRTGDAINNSSVNPFATTQSVIYAAPGEHGDGNAFDGAWNPSTGSGFILAHAFGPPDIDISNLHLDQDEMWVTSGATTVSPSATSASIDLVSILAHEFGHVLGLGHPSGNAGDLMQPNYFGPLTTLSADDIAAVRSLYACRGADCPTDDDDDDDTTTVPEPGTLFLMAIGLLGMAIGRRLHAR